MNRKEQQERKLHPRRRAKKLPGFLAAVAFLPATFMPGCAEQSSTFTLEQRKQNADHKFGKIIKFLEENRLDGVVLRLQRNFS